MTKGNNMRRVAQISFAIVFGVIMPAAVLGGGVWGAMKLIETAPQAKRGKKGGGERQGRLVETLTLAKEDRQVIVPAMGLVTPSRLARVQPRVSGEIVSVADSLVPGGRFKEGQELLAIDPTDYDLAIRRLEAQVAQARSALDIEMGQQNIAREEYEFLGQSIPESQKSLVLREPQLARARAELDVALAALEGAKLDRERATLKAPFNCFVIGETAEKGAIANPSNALAEVAGTDTFWVELTVPVDELRWIEMPAPGVQGAKARVFDEAAWEAGAERVGQVERFTSSVDRESRMATLLIAVKDPLALSPERAGDPPLLLNSYVRGEIEGRTLKDVVAIPRKLLHEGDTAWVMAPDGRLEIRQVRVAWRGRDEVYVSGGLEDGEILVASNLSAPVEGMLLRRAASASEAARAKASPESASIAEAAE